MEKEKKRYQFTTKNISVLYSYARPYQTTFFVGLVVLLLSSTTIMLFPHLLTKLIDSVLQEETSKISRKNILLILCGLVVAQAIFSYARIHLFSKVTENAIADLRVALFKKITSLEIHFFERRRVGELISRITNDISTLQDIFSFTLAEFIRQIVTLIIGIVMLLLISKKLTLIMLLVFPLFIILAIFFGRFIRKLSKKVQDKLAKANIIVEESFQNINIVKAYNNEAFETYQYKESNKDVIYHAVYAAKYRGMFVGFIILGLMSTIILMIYLSVGMVDSGDISVAKLMEFILYSVFLVGALGGLGDTYAKIQKTLGSSERLVEILGNEAEVERLPDDSSTPIVIKGGITYKNVHFSYPTRKDIKVLNDINIDITPGERIALVGHSGAGKSTIIQLLLKYYTSDSGDIIIDNKYTLKNLFPSQIRDHVAIVPQEIILFGGTIRDNIAYGKLNATEDEIINAAKKANAWEFITSFPEGLDSLVGERGVKLSGGQKQRIAIARAIIKDPSILILDEATSSLDAISENLIEQALEQFMPGRTTLIIAHRLSTVKNADKILVLNQGKIIEQGNHEELLNIPNGMYNNLLRLQLQES